MADAANAPTAHRGADPASSLVLASAPASARTHAPSTFTPATSSSGAPTARVSSATAVSSTRTTGSPDPAPFAEIRLMRRRVALGTLTHTLRSADATTDAELMVLSALSVASSLWRRVTTRELSWTVFLGFPLVQSGAVSGRPHRRQRISTSRDLLAGRDKIG